MTYSTFRDEPTTLWVLRNPHHQLRCLVQLAPRGPELIVERDGELFVSRRFEDGADDLVAWARAWRVELLQNGWTESG